MSGTAALIAPFVLDAIWIAAYHRFGAIAYPGGVNSGMPLIVCIVVGYVFLLHALRSWAIPAALLYIPLMGVALAIFELGIGCRVYDNCF